MSQAPDRTFKLDDWSLPVYAASNGDQLIPVDGLDAATQPGQDGLLLAQAEVPGAPHATPPADAHDLQAVPQAHEGVVAHDAAAAGHAEAGHGAEGAHGEAEHATGYQMPLEIPNAAMLIQAAADPAFQAEHGHRPHPSTAWFINPIFTLVILLPFVWLMRKALTRPSIERPSRLQAAMELLLGGLHKFFGDVLGPRGQKYVPYVMALFLYIWFNNLAGLVPLLKAPTSSFKTTLALGLCTFCYVHYNALREGGFKNWFMHLLGEPLWMAPLNFPLHVMGELIKPISLSLRLFGNLFGEDKLLAAFLGMGMLIVSALFHVQTPMIGVPLHLPFFFLAILTCTIQAAVFSLLASVYIVLLMPHEHEDHDGEAHEGQLVDEHGHAAVHGDGKAESPIAL